MKLKDCELVPGVIVSVEDETHQGRVKCIIPGVISDQVSQENSPWIRPLAMGGYQTFSKEMVGSKVWILINTANYNEYWYFPFFEMNNVALTQLTETYDNDQPEIFMAHDTGGNNAISMYDETNGYRMMTGEHHINMSPDGHINIKGGDKEIDINGVIKLGVEGKGEKAVLGETLSKVLNELKKAFDQLYTLSGNPNDSALSPGFDAARNALKGVDNILSDNVQIN